MAWSTILVHKAAIATVMDPTTHTPMSQHPLVSRFMKSVFQARPPARQLKPIWDVAVVLREMLTWGTSSALSRTRLTWRLTMLIALASARRASDLTCLHVGRNNIFLTESLCRLTLVFGTKQDRPGHLAPDVVLARQSTEELCPIRNLQEYLERTKDERQNDHQLLRITIPRYTPAKRTTIRRWLSQVLKQSHIDATGGSTRAAAATWAAAKAVSIATIMAAADWTEVRTMSRHYLRQLPQEAPVSEHLSVQRALLGV